MSPRRLCFLLSMLSCAASTAVTGQTSAPTSTSPRLAVVISIDQMRADYLQRFRPWFAAGGFERLLSGGTSFTDCHYRCALTATAPGHATLLTGVHANIHGIVANEWYDFATSRSPGAVQDSAAPLVGAASPSSVRTPGGIVEAQLGVSGASPRKLLVTTVGDQLKLRHGARSRVVSVANKDRAAILLGGRLADSAYWIHEGRFVTSRYYRDTLPAWVDSFNATRPVESAFGSTWERLLDASIYDTVQGPDDAPGEESRLGLGITFPRRIDGGSKEITSKFYEAHRLAPASSELLGRFAQLAIVEEKLGRHDSPDLLCIGFSQIDYAGHSYGPDSHEIMDAMIRLDRVLADLFNALDREVGVGRYLVVLSADHAVSPLPERVQAFNRDVTAGRLDWPRINASIEAALTASFGPPVGNAPWTVRDAYGYHLVPATLAAQNVSHSAAAATLKATLLRDPQVATAWTRGELLAPATPVDEPHLLAWRLSFHRDRSPDVVFTPHPYVVDRSPFGTNHGTPYDYDNHVPLLWYGAGVPARTLSTRVAPDALAPTLSALLGVPAPPDAVAPRLF